MLLTFYSLFKQATNGKCGERKPAFWDVVKKYVYALDLSPLFSFVINRGQSSSRAKWDAWNRLGEMPREVAMQKYVDELKKVSIRVRVSLYIMSHYVFLKLLLKFCYCEK